MAPAKTPEEKLFYRRLQQMLFYALQRKRGFSIDELVHRMLPHVREIILSLNILVISIYYK